MYFFSNVWQVSTQPTAFFAINNGHETIPKLLWYLYRVISIAVLLGLLTSLYLKPQSTSQITQLTENYGATFPLYVGLITLLAPIGLILFQMLNALIMYALIRLIGGHGTYRDSLLATVYGTSPNLVAGLPMIGIFTNLLALYVTWVGLAKLHHISLWKSSIITLVSYFITLSFLANLLI